MTTKKSHLLTLRDRLSRLTYLQACKHLGPEAVGLLRQGGQLEVDIDADVEWQGDRLRLRVMEAEVTFELGDGAPRRLRFGCSACTTTCAHLGAAFALILEEKLLLGLSAAPDETRPIEHMSPRQLVEHALEQRAQRARAEKMTLRSNDPSSLWTDYTVTSAATGKTYRLALRGWERGESFCSCPDFRKNTLGTCKHVLHALAKLERRFPAALREGPYRRRGFSVALRYGDEVELWLQLPHRLPPDARAIVGPLAGRPVDDVHDLMARVAKLERRGHEVVVYPDAEEHIQQALHRDRIARLAADIRRDPAAHPLRHGLLKTTLLPYQLDGVAFAVAAGRAILADDMGLGKTIQGIGVAELLARQAGTKRVLVVCPTSLKTQWAHEVARFSDRSYQLVIGSAAERALQFGADAFFTICNYEQVLRDYLAIERHAWDLIILDEGQRLKNWEAKTSRIIKSLRSPFCLVLSGTPLENRLEDLYSVVELIDDRRLGPAFRFLHSHREVDERGRVLGYKKLDELRRRLAPVLLRRTRASVLDQLPPRTNEIVRIPPTDEQIELHGANMRIVSSIVRKTYLTEMDLLRLRKALLMCRMAADSTFLVDKRAPGYSSKLERLEEIFDDLAAEPDRKVVLFSDWTTMLDLIEPLLEARGIDFVRLDGSVPQTKRGTLVSRFQREASCRFFITTNAGSTGLNLQAANTVINVDLPWNPAVLEQRIARAHRMGQKRPVHVILLVTEDTIEDNLLATLSAKHELALAALDVESEVTAVDMVSGIDELKRRLEVLLGAQPEAPLDESQRQAVEQQSAEMQRARRVADRAGELLRAAFALVEEMLPDRPEAQAARQLAALLRASEVEPVDAPNGGRLKLAFTLPDTSTIDLGASG